MGVAGTQMASSGSRINKLTKMTIAESKALKRQSFSISKSKTVNVIK